MTSLFAGAAAAITHVTCESGELRPASPQTGDFHKSNGAPPSTRTAEQGDNDSSNRRMGQGLHGPSSNHMLYNLPSRLAGARAASVVAEGHHAAP